jgi:hypothetical protein
MAIHNGEKGLVVETTKLLIVGATKHLPAGTSVSLDGSSYTLDEIAQKLQALVDLRSNVNAAKASVRATLALEVAQAPALTAFSRQFRAYVKATFANSPAVLADFGIFPKQRSPQTTQAKTAAVVKGAATRASRHTMGPKQKLAVKGDVTGVVITPVKASEPAVPATNSPTVTSSPTAPATSGGPTATTAQHTS